MARKRIKKTGSCWRKQKIERRLRMACQAVDEERAEAAVEICKQLLRHVEPGSCEDVEAMVLLGVALMMKDEFRPAWEVLTLAASLDPTNPDIWYHRALAARHCLRLVGSTLDLERALALTTDPPIARSIREELSLGRRLVARELAARGEGFTLKQFLEVEDAFQEGLEALEDFDFKEGAAAFQKAVEKDRDCRPLACDFAALCLLFDRRFEEAEAAIDRALKIDPNDDFARIVAEALGDARSVEQPQFAGIENLLRGAVANLAAG